jgi:glycosyltransferase involved in cell wall biosynthesis
VTHGPGFARNDGIRAAKGRVIAFTDADCIVSGAWLSAIADAILGAHTAFVGGETWCDETLVFPWRGSPAGQQWITANLAMDRDRLPGHFFSDEFQGLVGGDTDFVFRAVERGVPYTHIREMRVFHPARELGVSAMLRRAMYRRNEVLLFKKHGRAMDASMSPMFRPRILGRMSPASAVFFGGLVWLAAAAAMGSSAMILAAAAAVLAFVVAFLSVLWKACVRYRPEGKEREVLSLRDRIRTLAMLAAYVPAFVLARIIGSLQNRTLYL